MTPDELLAKAAKLRRIIAALQRQTDAASAAAPGWVVTGRSGRTARMERKTERAIETTVRNAVKIVRLERAAKSLEAEAEFISSGAKERHEADWAEYKAQERERIKRENAERRRTLREGDIKARIFVGVYPEGLMFADKLVELHGDYRHLGFLSYRTLKLTVYKECPGYLIPVVVEMAQPYIDKRGERFETDGAGHSVILGGEDE